MTAMDPRLVVEALDRAVATGDIAALDTICHPDMITHSFGPTMPQGIGGIGSSLAAVKRQAGAAVGNMSSLSPKASMSCSSGTRSFDWPGGPFRGFDVPSGHLTYDCAFMFRVRDGLITDRWAIRDDLALMVQLGAVAADRPNEVMQGTVTSQRGHPFE